MLLQFVSDALTCLHEELAPSLLTTGAYRVGQEVITERQARPIRTSEAPFVFPQLWRGSQICRFGTVYFINSGTYAVVIARGELFAVSQR
jgi:hypothetical protein